MKETANHINSMKFNERRARGMFGAAEVSREILTGSGGCQEHRTLIVIDRACATLQHCMRSFRLPMSSSILNVSCCRLQPAWLSRSTHA